MKVYYIVHGIVQGVGYRSLVKRAANKNNIKGSVRNAPDGTVEIFCDGEDKDIKNFETDIDVYNKYGVQVFKIERFLQQDTDFNDFSVKEGFTIQDKD